MSNAMKTKIKKRALSWSQQVDDIFLLEAMPDLKMALLAEIIWEADEYRRKQEERNNAKRKR